MSKAPHEVSRNKSVSWIVSRSQRVQHTRTHTHTRAFARVYIIINIIVSFDEIVLPRNDTKRSHRTQVRVRASAKHKMYDLGGRGGGEKKRRATASVVSFFDISRARCTVLHARAHDISRSLQPSGSVQFVDCIFLRHFFCDDGPRGGCDHCVQMLLRRAFSRSSAIGPLVIVQRCTTWSSVSRLLPVTFD